MPEVEFQQIVRSNLRIYKNDFKMYLKDFIQKAYLLASTLKTRCVGCLQ